MAYIRPSYEQLINQATGELQALGINPLPISLTNAFVGIVAALTNQLYGYLDYIQLQAIPITATTPFIDQWANLFGLYRIPATASSGQVLFQGSGTLVAGTIIARSDNFQYALSQNYVLGANAVAPFTAVVAGTDGDAPSGISLSLAASQVGVQQVGTAASPITGGADAETDQALLRRLIVYLSNQPQGGAASDYVDWSLDVAGITRAWAISPGGGNVQVFIMLDGAEEGNGGFPVGTNGGATAETRIAPATGDQLTVANYIYPLRPVTAIVEVIAPLPYTVDFRILNVPNLTTNLQNSITSALEALFVQEGNPIASAIEPSDMYAAILGAGAQKAFLDEPSAPIITPTGYLPVVGTMTWS